MQHPQTTAALLGAALAPGAASARAGTVSHVSHGDFKAGSATGAAVIGGPYDFNGADAAHGAVFILPTPGDTVLAINFTTTATSLLRTPSRRRRTTPICRATQRCRTARSPTCSG